MLKKLPPRRDKNPFTGHILTGHIVEDIVFGVILVLLFIFVCRLLAPFFTVFLWSVLIYIIVDPFYQKCVKKISRRTKWGAFCRTFIAGLFAIISVLIILVPLSLVVSQLYVQGVAVFKNLKNYVSENKEELAALYDKVADFISKQTGEQLSYSADDIHQNIIAFFEGIFKKLFQAAGVLIKDIGLLVLGFALIVFCLFFFYLDASYLAVFIKNLIPIKSAYVKTLSEKFKEITRGLILGYITVALIQSLCAFIIFTAFNVEGAFIFACLTFICVFIPMLGGALVWLPLGITRIIDGSVFSGILMIILSAIFISFLDNFLRPYFLQDRLKLHPLLIFFAIMGGLKLFGFNGLILGPLIIVLFVTVIEMFFKEYNIKKEVIVPEDEYELEREKK